MRRSDPTQPGLNKDRFRAGRRAAARLKRLARDPQKLLPGFEKIVAERPIDFEKVKVARPRKRRAAK
jgi:hypothetical protein